MIVFANQICVFRLYCLQSPSQPLTFNVKYQRSGIFVAGRYCKNSRVLPQSPWTANINDEPRKGHSVGSLYEKLLL